MKKVSICGVDGSGKTTLLGEIARLAGAGRAPAAVLRAPQYSHGNALAVNPLADEIQRLSERADEAGLPALKACVLFLGMTLYGAAESELCEQSKCQVLFRERDPVVDSITYAQIYVRLLQAPFSDRLVSTYESAAVDEVLSALRQRQPLGFEGLSFASLPTFVRAVFATPFPEVVSVLEQLYGTSTADVIVFLRLSPAMMKTRMEKKAAASGGGVPEFHEKQEILAQLQAGMERAIVALRERQRFEVETIEVVDRPAEELAEDLLRRYGG